MIWDNLFKKYSGELFEHGFKTIVISDVGKWVDRSRCVMCCSSMLYAVLVLRMLYG